MRENESHEERGQEAHAIRDSVLLSKKPLGANRRAVPGAVQHEQRMYNLFRLHEVAGATSVMKDHELSSSAFMSIPSRRELVGIAPRTVLRAGTHEKRDLRKSLSLMNRSA